jgi:DNA repair protein RadC
VSEETKLLTIKAWAEEDRPREKLLEKGRLTLTDAELIAILISSGNKNETAVDLSKRILSEYKNNLHELAKLNVTDLTQFKGIGEAKAITIIAALELGRRRKDAEPQKQIKITTSRDAYVYIKSYMLDLPHEEFHVLYLNRANAVIKSEQISTGGVSGTVVDTKIIFKKAIEQLASSIILFHNHPSGNLKPSDADIKLTKNLKEAGAILKIPVADHIIVTNHAYYSFADEGMI